MLLLSTCSLSQVDSCLPSYPLPLQKMVAEQGIQIGYVEAGRGHTIVLLHGLGGNISHWIPAMNELTKKYHVLALDFPGYGTSNTFIPDSSLDLLNVYADIVVKLIRSKNIKSITLVGHSMGAQVAIIGSLKYPRLIQKLILVAPAGLETFTDTESDILLAATRPEVFEKQDESAIRASYKNNFYVMPQGAEVLIQQRLHLARCTRFTNYTRVVSAGVKGMLKHRVDTSLKNLEQPVLIIFGENDALIPNRYLHPQLTTNQVATAAVKNMRNSKSVTIPQAGHLVQYEKPREVSIAIQHFLQ